MSTAILLPALLSLLPVLGLLGALVFFDSYKLVPLPTVAALVLGGVATTAVCYVVNGWLIGRLGIGLQPFSRYVSPFVEEAGKALLVVWLIRRNRIGFMVDAAIVGFALGGGFALAENLYSLWRLPDVEPSTWIVRGFGTAIMHGGATALFAVIALALVERDERRKTAALVPAYLLAVMLHSAFNHLSRESVVSVPLILLAVSALLTGAYSWGERALDHWLRHGFDADAELIALIKSGGLGASPTGVYLDTLKRRFDGLVLADLLAYLRLFTELSMRAKGVLMMRENGFEAAVDPEAVEQFAELSFLERSIGRTGLLALHPLLPMRRKALRQMLAF